MIHQRHFTLVEAQQLLPQVEPMVRKLHNAGARLSDAELHELLSDAAPGNGGGEPGRAVGEDFVELRSLVAELQGRGIVVRDVSRGLIDFPSIREDREIYLCWELGEDEIAYWHELDTGYGGRRPLD